jgi:hypothetical protein
MRNRLQAFAFKCNLYRYNTVTFEANTDNTCNAPVLLMKGYTPGVVGRCRLNQVDP